MHYRFASNFTWLVMLHSRCCEPMHDYIDKASLTALENRYDMIFQMKFSRNHNF